MRIDRHDGLFVAYIKFEDRQLFKDAGWRWNARQKKWVTTDDRKVEPFYKHTIGSAREYFDNKRNLIDESLAEDYQHKFPAPDGLEYKPFQQAGIAFALKRKDTLFADPPGLGKTVQSIGVSNVDQSSRVLSIVPASLMKMWEREWRRWDIHGRSVGIIQVKTRTKTENGKVVKRWLEYIWPDTDIVILNYEMVSKFRSYIEAVDWALLIVDESHYLKNGKTQRTVNILGGGRGKKNIKPIEAKRRLFLTGTPITKRPIDLWPTCKAFDPDGLGKNWTSFVYRYCGAYETHFGTDTTGSSNLDEFQDKLRMSFMVRRNKESVLKELPPKTRQVIELPNEGLRRIIERENDSVRELLEEFEKVLGNPKKESKEIKLEDIPELIEKRFGHLSHLLFDERVEQMAPGERVLFEHMAEIRKELAIAMVPMVCQYVERLLDADEKVILFCYHKDVAEELKQHYPDCAFITGSVPNHKRQAEVDKFQDDESCRVFIGNITAAGVGHTLTASTNVVFAELSWLPSELEQAEDRAWRIGQLNAVLIHLLVVEGSLGARMVESIVEAMKIINQALDKRPDFT